ncbi:MAG: ABC transporter permease [Alphaproteobacteria bacterium]
MRYVVAKALALGLFRDLGALAMAFLLPPAVFVIFALIFSRTAGADIQVGVAIADLVESADTQSIRDSVTGASTVRLVPPIHNARADVEAMLRRGEADVGLVIGAAEGPGAPPSLQVLISPARDIAGTVLSGTVRQAMIDLLGADMPPLPVTEERVGRDTPVPASIPYYAAAVAMLFLLLAACQGALSLHEERESGLLERMGSGPGGIGPVIDGKFLYLTLQGTVQVGVIFAVAAFGFGVEIWPVFGPWLFTTVLCAAAAAGLGLFFVALCQTRRQAMTAGNILVMILSALGGSMIPRFFMPPEIQTLGWATPNTWGLEAYGILLWRGDTLSALVLPCGLLGGVALAGLLGARIAAARWA